MSHAPIDDGTYVVLADPQRRLSLWPAGRALPRGLAEAGFAGTRGDCIRWIDDATAAAARHPTEETAAR
jgi:uncharacterized protein YbdZ (MbtH family)